MIECIENNIAKVKDYSFFNRVMFLFENNKFTNSIFVNEINDKEYSDFSNCRNIYFDTTNACVSIEDLSKNAEYYSSTIKTFADDESYIDNLFLLVEEEMPIGTDIIYSIITSEGDSIGIIPNRNTPLALPKDKLPKSFKIKADLKTNGTDTPKINSIAIMYFDSIVDKKLGLIDPNISDI